MSHVNKDGNLNVDMDINNNVVNNNATDQTTWQIIKQP